MTASPAPSDEPATTICAHLGSPLASANCAHPSVGCVLARYARSFRRRLSMLFAGLMLTTGDVSTPSSISVRMLIAQLSGGSEGFSALPHPAGGLAAIGASLR